MAPKNLVMDKVHLLTEIVLIELSKMRYTLDKILSKTN